MPRRCIRDKTLEPDKKRYMLQKDVLLKKLYGKRMTLKNQVDKKLYWQDRIGKTMNDIHEIEMRLNYIDRKVRR